MSDHLLAKPHDLSAISDEDLDTMLLIEWLTECIVPRVSPEFSEKERAKLIGELGAGFVNLSSQWSSFESQISPLDEIWEYDSPAEYWNSLCGSSGIALVRGQKIIAEITIEKN